MVTRGHGKQTSLLSMLICSLSLISDGDTWTWQANYFALHVHLLAMQQANQFALHAHLLANQRPTRKNLFASCTSAKKNIEQACQNKHVPVNFHFHLINKISGRTSMFHCTYLVHVLVPKKDFVEQCSTTTVNVFLVFCGRGEKMKVIKMNVQVLYM